MPRISAKIFARDYLGAYREHHLLVSRRVEAAALIATDRASQIAKSRIRDAMTGARMGRLGKAIDASSDMQRSGTVFRRGGNSFSASGMVFIRSGSERTRGAIEAYTEGANILPKRDRFLWIPTDQIPLRGADRKRLTPATWASSGMERRIGPLVRINSVNGNPLLIVQNASVALSGKSRSARARTKTGKVRRGQLAKEFIVAFVAIPRTARSARIDVTAIMRGVQAELPDLFLKAIVQTANG